MTFNYTPPDGVYNPNNMKLRHSTICTLYSLRLYKVHVQHVMFIYNHFILLYSHQTLFDIEYFLLSLFIFIYRFIYLFL